MGYQMECPCKEASCGEPHDHKASWLIVEYAQTLLMSRLTRAIVEARSIETVPIARKTVIASPDWLMNGTDGRAERLPQRPW